MRKGRKTLQVSPQQAKNTNYSFCCSKIGLVLPSSWNNIQRRQHDFSNCHCHSVERETKNLSLEQIIKTQEILWRK